MDAVEFLKERIRMCLNYDECKGCPCEKSDSVSCNPCISEIETLVKIIEQWSQSHPQKTMMQDFFEKFPNAPKTMLGYPYPCAKDLGYPKLDSCSFGIKGEAGSYCRECWNRPLED